MLKTIELIYYSGSVITVQPVSPAAIITIAIAKSVYFCRVL